MKKLCKAIVMLCRVYCEVPGVTLKEKDRMNRLKQMYQQKLEEYDDESGTVTTVLSGQRD